MLMKSLSKSVFLAALILFTAVAGYGQDRPEGLSKSGDMIAGGGNLASAKDVGDIYIWRDCANIYVEFAIVDGTPGDYMDNWYITATHVEIALSMAEIPQAKGNPVPGRFTYKSEHDAVTGYIHMIPLNGFAGVPVAIAAHADVCQVGGAQGVMAALPADPFQVMVTFYDPLKTAYFPTVVIQNDTWLDGTHYNGWCVDVNRTIVPGTWYDSMAYSSYDPALPAGLVDNPDNLDLLNWLINADLVGKPATDEWNGSLGIYTWMDVQTAIWSLMDDDVSLFQDLGANTVRVDRILALAGAQEGYMPECGDFMVILISPYAPCASTQNQTLIIKVPVPCEGACETAWGAQWIDGTWLWPFPGKNWATYMWLIVPNYCIGD
jgi:hypothetical protein